MKKFAVYIRVSTQRQGTSGLGLESQRKICEDFITAKGGEKVAEFKDVESGTHRDRKGLSEAIAYCKKNNCGLVIAKLDRLARDVEFCFKVINTGIEIHFVDMPQINTLLLGVFASVAQYERELTSDRTKKALDAKRNRGESTGGACQKWRESYKNKTREQIDKEMKQRGTTKNKRHIESRDVQAFIKVLKNVFPLATKGDNMIDWEWAGIGTKNGVRQKVLVMMKDYKDLDPTLFVKWDFSDLESDALRVKLASYISNLRKSVKCYDKNN